MNTLQAANELKSLSILINATAKGAYTARYNEQYRQLLICAPVTPFREIGVIFIDASFLRCSLLPFLTAELAAVTAVLVSAGYAQAEPGSVRFSLPVVR